MAGGKKEVCGRDPRSTDFEARRTGSGWTVTQLPERSSRRAVPLRDGVCTKGPPRIKLRSFASSGRWSRASMRPIFDRDSSISPFLSLPYCSPSSFIMASLNFFLLFSTRSATRGIEQQEKARRNCRDEGMHCSPSLHQFFP